MNTETLLLFRRLGRGRIACKGCGKALSSNALGRAAHEKVCPELNWHMDSDPSQKARMTPSQAARLNAELRRRGNAIEWVRDR